MATMVTFSPVRAVGALRDLSKIFKSRPHQKHCCSLTRRFSLRFPSGVTTNNRSPAIFAPPSELTFTQEVSNPILRGHELHSRGVMTATCLDEVTLGFYGGGMMAGAILKGLLARNVVPPGRIWVCELMQARREALAKLGVSVTADGKELLSHSNTVVLAVKPDVVPVVLRTVAEHEKENKELDLLLISICAGIKLDTLAQGNPHRKCVRVMPNQPCLVGAAASAFTLSDGCSQLHREIVEALMGACGLVSELPEKNLDAVTGLSGSGPAYVYMMIEAMSDAGVREGLPRAVARQLAAQTVFGAAKTALEMPDVHLGELRNRVESPGGTTIVATSSLEEHGFRAAVIEAVSKSTARAKELGRKE